MKGERNPASPLRDTAQVVMHIEGSGCFIVNRIPIHYIKQQLFWGVPPLSVFGESSLGRVRTQLMSHFLDYYLS